MLHQLEPPVLKSTLALKWNCIAHSTLMRYKYDFRQKIFTPFIFLVI